jgi:hypothetical protein
MLRLTWILVLAALALPASASARPLDVLRNAKLQSASGTLTITETRCPAGAQPGSPDCGKATLDETFDSAAPRTRSVDGAPGFPAGFRATGRGRGTCEAESPTTVVNGPDGSAQLLGGSARVVPGRFDATRVVLAAGKHGVRIAWLEPFAPSIACDYFDEPGTTVDVPIAQGLPSAVIGPSALKRSRFSATIAGSQDWNEPVADGTQVSGHATWRIRLDYKR